MDAGEQTAMAPLRCEGRVSVVGQAPTALLLLLLGLVLVWCSGDAGSGPPVVGSDAEGTDWVGEFAGTEAGGRSHAADTDTDTDTAAGSCGCLTETLEDWSNRKERCGANIGSSGSALPQNYAADTAAGHRLVHDKTYLVDWGVDVWSWDLDCPCATED